MKRQTHDTTEAVATNRRELVFTALRRGIRKRCPHCGEGPIFSGFAHHLERCPVCGLVYERNPGDTWAFTIIGDRLPIAAIIVLIYFGVARSHPALGLAIILALGALLVVTAPNRWGVGIALHYLSRVFWPDPADPVPASPAAVVPEEAQYVQRAKAGQHESTKIAKAHDED